MAQVEAILDATADISDQQVITGDFNAVPGFTPIEAMANEYVDAFTAVGNGESDTCPAGYTDSAPAKRIDYAFTSDHGITVEGAGIGEETLISSEVSGVPHGETVPKQLTYVPSTLEKSRFSLPSTRQAPFRPFYCRW